MQTSLLGLIVTVSQPPESCVVQSIPYA